MPEADAAATETAERFNFIVNHASGERHATGCASVISAVDNPIALLVTANRDIVDGNNP